MAAGPGGVGDVKAYTDLRNQLHAIREEYRAAVVSQGQFGVDSIKIKSSTEEFTKALQKHRLSLGDLIRQRKTLNEVYKEQIALQNMTAVGWTKNGRGQISADLIIPNDLPKQFDQLSNRIAFYNKAINLASTNLINWGKNTQWAGRQMMVGLTVPLGMLSLAAGKAANDVDQQLTRIAKVYDMTYTGNMSAMQAAAAQERELATLRASSLELASTAAKKYGVAAKETLGVEAELAATGLKGDNLRRSTAEVLRIATLGELDYQKAVELSISLQNAYGLSTEEVTKKFNFLNSIENATSLSLQDVAESIPRAGAALAGLGVTVEQTGILLVAMKEHGVDAAEGANALKSATTRILKPTGDAIDRFNDLGINIEEVADQAKGNLFVVLTELSKRLNGVDPYKAQQAIAALFGTYQFNRLNAAIKGITDGMAGAGDQASQTARAIQVAGQSSAEWASTARGELDQLAESASGKLKRAFESLKVELAKAGAPILEWGAKALMVLTKLFEIFGNLPKPVKGLVIIAALFAGIVGPLVMLTGIFANLIGNIIKFGTSMIGVFKAFKITNAEERAALLLQEQATRGFNDQATAAHVLAQAIHKVTSELTAMNAALLASNLATAKAQLPLEVLERTDRHDNPYYVYGPSAAGQPGVPKNGRANRAAFDAYNAQKQIVDDFERAATTTAAQTASIANNSAKTAVNWNRIGAAAGGITFASAAVASMVSPASKVANYLMIASTASMALTAFGGINPKAIGAKFKQVGAAASAGFGNMKAAQGLKATMGATLGTISNMVGVFGRFAGPAGLLVGAGLLVLKMRRDLQKTVDTQREINNSAEQWSQILGYTYQKVVAVQGKQKSSAEDAKKLTDVNKALAERIGQARNEQELLNLAITEGIKVRTSGGSADDAMKAIDTVFRVAGKNNSEVEALTLKVKGQIDFTNMDEMVAGVIENFRQRVQQIAANDFSQSTTESFLRAIGIGDNLNKGAATAAEGVAKDFMQTLNTLDDKNKVDFFTKFFDNVGKNNEAIFARILQDPRNAEIMKKAGITNAEQFTNYYFAALSNAQRAGYNLENSTMPLPKMSDEDRQALERYNDSYELLLQNIAREAGLGPDVIKNIKTIYDLREKLQIPTKSLAEAESSYAERLHEAARAGQEMSDTQKLAALNSERLAAGLGPATTLAQGFGDAAGQAAQQTEQMSSALEQAGITLEDLQGAYQNGMSGINDAMINLASDEFDRQMQARVDRVKSAGERRIAEIEKRARLAQDAFDDKWTKRQDAFDDRWDKIMDNHDAKWDKRISKEAALYDARIAAVQKQIDAEKKADDERQSLFEAEKTRLERLANLQNKNIDFNVALKGGNLDEAAKIANDITAQNSQYMYDDAAAASRTASEKRIAQLEDKKAAIEAEKDARLDLLKKMEQAEKDSLERRKVLAKRALDAQKEQEKRALDARLAQQKAYAQKQIEAEQKRAQREVEIEKTKFQMELKAIQTYIPKNAKERADQMAAIEALYKKYGVKFTTFGKQWADIVGTAIKSNMKTAGNSLRNDINWKQIGAKAASDAISGAFGMTVDQFAKWVSTGEMPADGLGGRSKPGKGLSNQAKKNIAAIGGSFHSGGIVGQTMGRRTGVPSFAPQRPSEVTANLLKGEAVLNRNATHMIGHDMINNLNSGRMQGAELDAIGGPDLGMAGLVGAGIAAMIRTVIGQAVNTAGARVSDFGSLNSGTISGVKLGAEQLRNASAIISAARSFGASNRDIVIALMTAMQESTLRNLNYGDRDSIGLFQQRNAWGSREERLNPYLATKMFFYGGRAGQRGLFDYRNRDEMSLTQAAQAVQRSAFPNAYARWESIARALLGGYSSTGINFVSGSNGGYGRPLKNYRVSSEYGYRIHPITGARRLHNGIDLAAPTGTPIFASAGGGVAKAAPSGGYGNWTVLNHPGGIQTAYAHQSRIGVRPGQSVSKGQVIGSVGSTGMSTGPHLHFMVGRNGNWINPRTVIPGLSDGGFTLNTGLARLHPDEAVLTKPLTQDLKDGIRNIDSSSKTEYNITIDARGATMTEAEFKRATKSALMEIEKEKGINRKVSVGR